MGFSRQEYWSGLPLPSPEDLSDPAIEPGVPHGRQTLYHLSHQGSPLTIDDLHQTIKPIRVLTFGIAFMGFSGGASGKESTCQCRRCKR